MQEFPKNYDFKEREKYWQDFWKKKAIYKWQNDEIRENNFVIDTPPPTVSGKLHIGHVYSYTHTDFIARFQRMKGKNVFYPMGFDDNGLPTERLVEKQKQVKASSMTRSEFIKICKELVEDEEEKFRKLFNSIALSVDWSLEFQSISPLSCQISQMSFLDLVQKEEIYRNEQPVLWDPVDMTALAQAEIEDKEKQSKMNDIVFYTENGEKLIIATTRPEMLPACVSIFYHPEDARYKHLAGQFAISALFNSKVKIIEDELVQQDKGTGLVMCCTFGDQTDILWWKKHNLPLKIIVTKDGKIDFSSFFPDSKYLAILNKLKINEARNKIIDILRDENLLTNQVEITQTVKCAERSGAPLEIITAPQWFIHSLKHKEALLRRSEELNWHPKYMKTRLDNWINALSWDWCISRQRYFGVPFPVWYSKRASEYGKAIFADIDQLPIDPLVDLPKNYSREEVEADPDIMDTWATSAVSPQLSSHAISKDFAIDLERHKKLFPADLRPQAHEIIRIWAFGTILKAHLHENVLPWKNIMVSGWCLAEDRSKMSKSKGNIIDPETLLEVYGADVIRYWSSKSKLGADTAYSEDLMKNGNRLVNKLWNASKFISQNFALLEKEDKELNIAKLRHRIVNDLDNWFILQLSELVTKYESDMREYEYSMAMDKLEKFFWSNFCDDYLETIKIRSYNEDGSNDIGQYSAVLALYHSMKIILKLFAPFLPHITEEIYQMIYEPAESIHLRNSWLKIEDWNINDEATKSEELMTIVSLVRKFKAEKNLSVKAPLGKIELICKKFSDNLKADLKNVTSIAEIDFVTEFSTDGNYLEANKIKINIIDSKNF